MPPSTVKPLSRSVDSQSWWTAALLLVCAFGPALLLVPSNYWPAWNLLPDADPAVYTYVAREWLRGHPPYVAAWDHKGPVMPAIYGAGLLLGANGMLVVLWLLQGVSAGLVGAVTRARFGNWFGIGAAAGFLLLQVRSFQGGGYTEDVGAPFLAGALYAWHRIGEPHERRRWAALMGACATALLLIRVNQAVPAFVLLAFAVAQEPWKRFVPSLAGSVALAAPFVVGLAIQGAIPAMVDACWNFNRLYADVPLLEQAWSLVGLIKYERFGGLSPLMIGGIGFGLAMWIRRDVFWRGVTCAALATLVVTALSGRTYWHYLTPWAPFAVLFSAWIVHESLQKSPALGRGALMILIAFGGSDLRYFRERYRAAKARDGYWDLRTTCKSYVQPGDTIFVLGSGPLALYLDTDTTSPNRFFAKNPILAQGYSGFDMADFERAWHERPPKLVVDAYRLLPLADGVSPASSRPDDREIWPTSKGINEDHAQRLKELVSGHYHVVWESPDVRLLLRNP